MTIRATADHDEAGYRVCLLERMTDDGDYWQVLDMATGESIAVIVSHLVERHDLHKAMIVVRDNAGNWVEPDCISVAEALECTL